jgi:seryl-tRNA synthetase
MIYTLNGSGLATARILVSIIETYQTSRGTVRVPDVLKLYMNGITEIKKTN